MDVFKQRLFDEYNTEAILTAPAVPYKCMLKNKKVQLNFNLGNLFIISFRCSIKRLGLILS